jgi:hypothetical protein
MAPLKLLGSGCAKTTKTFVEVDPHYLDDVRKKIMLSDQLLRLFDYTLFYFLFRTAVLNGTPSVQEVVAHSATQMRSLATHDAAEAFACKWLLPTPTKKQKIRAVVKGGFQCSHRAKTLATFSDSEVCVPSPS